ncbi:hypothetical protein BHM03_00028214 [Ensete ventricosum]|nr:hypothetical protein BHM03_00028214 [Ensete ventricosum]
MPRYVPYRQLIGISVRTGKNQPPNIRELIWVIPNKRQHENQEVHLGPRFAISTFTARYGRYIPVRQVAGTRTTRYQAVPPKIYRRRSISAIGDRLKGEIDRQRSIEREKGKKKKKKKRKKKKKKRKEEKKNTYRPRVVLARAPSPPAGRGRFFSCARRKIEAMSSLFLFVF